MKPATDPPTEDEATTAPTGAPNVGRRTESTEQTPNQSAVTTTTTTDPNATRPNGPARRRGGRRRETIRETGGNTEDRIRGSADGREAGRDVHIAKRRRGRLVANAEGAARPGDRGARGAKRGNLRVDMERGSIGLVIKWHNSKN